MRHKKWYWVAVHTRAGHPCGLECAPTIKEVVGSALERMPWLPKRHIRAMVTSVKPLSANDCEANRSVEWDTITAGRIYTESNEAKAQRRELRNATQR